MTVSLDWENLGFSYMKLLCVNDDMAMTENDLEKFSKILSNRYPDKSQFEL